MQSLEPDTIQTQNRWQLLNGENGNRKPAPKKGKGKPNGGPPMNGAGGLTGSDAIAAFKGQAVQNGGAEVAANGADGMQSWSTYANRSNSQKARKENKSVRVVTVEEAVRELDEKAAAVNRGNLGGRVALWGQWCRKMEDARLDADVRYVEPASNGAPADSEAATITFDEIFLRSRALEECVGSVLRQPVSDDAELTFLFSHCLEGDAMLHRKLADGFRVLGEAFRDSASPIPEEFVEQLVGMVRALKVRPRAKRESAGASRVHKLDEEIAFQLAKAQQLSREGHPGAEARHRCTAELVRLGSEKQRLVGGGEGDEGEVEEEQLRVLFEEMVALLGRMQQAASAAHAAAQKQYDAFQHKIKAAMMGDDVEYMRVLEVDQKLDADIARLAERKRELERELEEVSLELAGVEHRKRQHLQASAKVMSVYNTRIKAFQNDDNKMAAAFKASQAALDRATRSHAFIAGLCDTTVGLVAERRSRGAREAEETRRQLLGLLRGHLETVGDGLELVERRFKFCRSKLDSMRAELQEAKDIGLSDLAADLASAVAKFEDMQLEAHRGLEGADAEMDKVAAVLEGPLAHMPEADAEAAQQRAALLEQLAALRATRQTLLPAQQPQPEQ